MKTASDIKRVSDLIDAVRSLGGSYKEEGEVSVLSFPDGNRYRALPLDNGWSITPLWPVTPAGTEVSRQVTALKLSGKAEGSWTQEIRRYQLHTWMALHDAASEASKVASEEGIKLRILEVIDQCGLKLGDDRRLRVSGCEVGIAISRSGAVKLTFGPPNTLVLKTVFSSLKTLNP